MATRKSRKAPRRRAAAAPVASAPAAPTSPGHDAFLQDLLDAFPKCVFLVGRYANDALGLADGTFRVFFPDLHWMSRDCLARYTGGYRFTGNEPAGGPLFATLLSVLETARSNGAPLEVFQLGDRFDLWRETTPSDGTVLAAFDRLLADPAVGGLSSRLDQLGTQYVRGNHDAWMREVEKSRPELPKTRDEITTQDGRLLLVHGHRFQNIEKLLPDELKAAFVGMAPHLKPGKYDVGPFPSAAIKRIRGYLDLRNKAHRPDLYPDVVPAGARLLESVGDVAKVEADSQTFLDVSIFSHGTGTSNDFEHISYIEFADQTLKNEQNHPSDHSVHVIGHTHHARLLVDRLPGTGKPHVTLDCGSWIEKCTVRATPQGSSSVVPSAQFGVQIGNDIRIYQLNPAPLEAL